MTQHNIIFYNDWMNGHNEYPMITGEMFSFSQVCVEICSGSIGQ